MAAVKWQGRMPILGLNNALYDPASLNDWTPAGQARFHLGAADSGQDEMRNLFSRQADALGMFRWEHSGDPTQATLVPQSFSANGRQFAYTNDPYDYAGNEIGGAGVDNSMGLYYAPSQNGFWQLSNADDNIVNLNYNKPVQRGGIYGDALVKQAQETKTPMGTFGLQGYKTNQNTLSEFGKGFAPVLSVIAPAFVGPLAGQIGSATGASQAISTAASKAALAAAPAFISGGNPLPSLAGSAVGYGLSGTPSDAGMAGTQSASNAATNLGGKANMYDYFSGIDGFDPNGFGDVAAPIISPEVTSIPGYNGSAFDSFYGTSYGPDGAISGGFSLPDSMKSIFSNPKMLAAIAGGLLSNSGSKQAGTTTTTATSEPWKPMQPYLLSMADRAANLYGTTGMSPAQQSWNQYGQDVYSNFAHNPQLMESVLKSGADANKGAFDTSFGTAGNVSAPQVDMVQARASLGLLDPSRALGGLLSGRPDNPYLDQQAQAITGQATRNLLENVMPNIRSGAMAAGQYGGSRQGIAEGLAMSRMNQDLAPALTSLYGGAYENAQQRMYGTANSLNDQAMQTAVGNANRNFAGQTYNADLTLRNNQQQMQQAQQNLQNRVTGSNLINGGLNGVNNLFNAGNATYDYTRNSPWQDLSRYQSVIQPLANLGKTGTESTPYYTNTIGNIVGGFSTGMNLYDRFSNPQNANTQYRYPY